MSARQEAIASDKQRLLARSQLTRLRLRYDSLVVRKALRPAATLAPMVRFVGLASRAVLYVRLARSVIAFARTARG